jgi:hypothetical protein
VRRVATLVGVVLLAHVGVASAAVDVRVSVTPQAVLFGDAFEERVDVVAGDDTAAREARVTIDAGPFTALGAPRVERRRRGDSVVVSTTQRLACLAAECLAGRRGRSVRLPAPVVRVNGEVSKAPAGHVLVRSRVPASAIAGRQPPLRRTTVPPAPAYRVAPGTLTAILVVIAALLASAAIGLVLVELRRLRQSRPVDSLGRALRLLRESLTRSAGDRRRAADLLSRVLDDRGDRPLAERATTLAWAPPQPTAPDAEALAGDAEQLLEARG